MSTTNSAKNIFLKSHDGEYSYAHLNSFAAHFKLFLKEKQIQPNRPIGILASSSDEVIFIVAACWVSGIPFVCFNKDEKEKILAGQIKTLEPSIIFTDDERLAFQSSIYANVNDLQMIKWINSNIEKRKEKKWPCDDTFSYFFTSGTTSNPKIVPLKRRQMISAAKASTHNIKLSHNDFWLLCMPLHHIGGVSIILRSLIYRSAIYRVDSLNLLSKILSNNPAAKVVSLVPTMLNRLLDDDTFQPHKQLKILLGGGPVHTLLLEEALKKNINVINSYGMTETCAQIAAQPVRSADNKSVGAIFKPNKIQIRDENGNLQKANKPGLIWLKGPQVFDGYSVNRDSSLSQSPNSKRDKYRFTNNGWFNTGDFGRIDEKRRLYIETRRTDLIITGGENVSPTEVEEALLSVSGINEAAVTGLPDEEWGQIVAAALVIKKSHKFTANQIKQQLKKKLPSYKIPKKIVLIDSLPHTSTGKIKRSELKKLF